MAVSNVRSRWYMQLHWRVAAAMLLGVIAGLVGGEPLADSVGWLGTLFIKLLKMIIVPLVLTSIVTGVASVGAGAGLGRLFGKTLGYYILTSFLAVMVGLVMVNTIQPGVGADLVSSETREMPDLTVIQSPVDLILDIVPDNFFAAAADTEMLAIIFFSIVLGISISTLKQSHREPLLSFFESGFAAMMKLTGGIIHIFAPIGVFALIAKLMGTTGLGAFKALGLYALMLVCGLSLHLFITLPLVLRLLGGINPITHFRNMVQPIVMAFSTSSSGATLPVTIETVENKVGVSNRVTSFVLPMGATVNMDGTALYECAGVLFIAQVMGVQLGFEQQLVVVFTALLASIGAAAVPSAGLVVIFIVLQAVNLTGPQVELIVGAMLAVDRPLDMYRTVVNVFSDSCGAAIIARSEGETGVDVEVRNPAA
ncbi:MAG: dicarboxylate/amino acid:cation symporter [Bryobacterales bacterium]|nr:dicarboxylate/amino acid:cation symporter [Bryobacterales bacterium]MDE0293105.1 dicarboxylate/amino acid:cation symporter [Bryobacterales bacterium]MDE0432676.1 dicarboxylate/amino acid:cation symporter [Bryobacterales bacterium]